MSRNTVRMKLNDNSKLSPYPVLPASSFQLISFTTRLLPYISHPSIRKPVLFNFARQDRLPKVNFKSVRLWKGTDWGKWGSGEGAKIYIRPSARQRVQPDWHIWQPGPTRLSAYLYLDNNLHQNWSKPLSSGGCRLAGVTMVKKWSDLDSNDP